MKIFVSYTIRGGEIDRLYLENIEKKLSCSNDIYIDLLHNIDNTQEKVIDELISSDKVIVIMTSKIAESPWVETELRVAKENEIPIIYIDKNQLLNERIPKT